MGGYLMKETGPSYRNSDSVEGGLNFFISNGLQWDIDGLGLGLYFEEQGLKVPLNSRFYNGLMSLEQLWFACNRERKLDTNISVGPDLWWPHSLQKDTSFNSFNTQPCDCLIAPIVQEMKVRSREVK